MQSLALASVVSQHHPHIMCKPPSDPFEAESCTSASRISRPALSCAGSAYHSGPQDMYRRLSSIRLLGVSTRVTPLPITDPIAQAHDDDLDPRLGGGGGNIEKKQWWRRLWLERSRLQRVVKDRNARRIASLDQLYMQVDLFGKLAFSSICSRHVLWLNPKP